MTTCTSAYWELSLYSSISVLYIFTTVTHQLKNFDMAFFCFSLRILAKFFTS